MRCVLPACAILLVATVSTVAARDYKETRRVFPANGATDVPLNASVWILGVEQGAYVLVDNTADSGVERRLGHSYWGAPAITRLALGGLAARHAYTVRTYTGDRVTTFTTGDTLETTPPDPPTIERVRYEPGRLSISAAARDSVAVWVTTQRIIDAGLWVWQLFPADTFNAAFEACQQFDMHDAGGDCVELRSVDLAGNMSAIVSNCTPVSGRIPWASTEADHVNRGLILIGFSVLAGLGLIIVWRWVMRVDGYMPR